MKLKGLWLAPMLLFPAIAWGQGAQAQAKPDLTVHYDVMTTNVAAIAEPGEKERWIANTDLWEIKLAEAGTIAEAELDKMTESLDRIKTNVAKVTDAAEKERWEANVQLWQMLIGQKGVFAKGDADKLKDPFERMKANVAGIAVAAEKERWQANRDMWQVLIDRASAEVGMSR